MTATAEKTQGKRRDPARAVVYPQVNLLPPEVKAARTVRRVKAWLVLVLVVAVAANAAVAFLAISAQSAANPELTAAQAGPSGSGRRPRSTPRSRRCCPSAVTDGSPRARGLDEVLWAPYLSAISATTPDGVSVDTISVVEVTPMTEPFLPPTDALAGTNVASGDLRGLVPHHA